MHRIAILALAACGPKVIEKAPPSPSIAFYQGTEPVAVGTPLQAMVMWDATCENVSIGVEGGGGQTTRPCKPVPNSVEVQCENAACTSRPTGDNTYLITPTKAGMVKGTLVVKDRRGRAATSYPFTIETVLPEAAQTSCSKMGDDVVVNIELKHRGRSIQTVPPKVVGDAGACSYNGMVEGDDAAPMTFLQYTCKAPAASLKLSISTPTYKVETSTDCT